MGNKTAKQLREECERQILKLQEECKHPEDFWAVEEWALAHMTGRQLRICRICEKVLEVVEEKGLDDGVFLLRTNKIQGAVADGTQGMRRGE